MIIIFEDILIENTANNTHRNFTIKRICVVWKMYLLTYYSFKVLFMKIFVPTVYSMKLIIQIRLIIETILCFGYQIITRNQYIKIVLSVVICF